MEVAIGITALILAIAIAIWQNHKSKKIAEVSGALKKVDLDITLFGHSLLKKRSFEEIVYGHSVNKGDMIYCNLPIRIVNNGNKSAHNIILKIEFPKILRAGLENNISLNAQGGDESDVRLNTYEEGDYEYATYRLPELGPGGHIIVKEIIIITHAETLAFRLAKNLKKEIGNRTKFIASVNTKIRLNLGVRDEKSLKVDFGVRVYPTAEKAELLKIFSRIESNENSVMFPEYGITIQFKNIGYRPINNNALVIIPKLKKEPKPKEYSHRKESVYYEVLDESDRFLISPQPVKKA